MSVFYFMGGFGCGELSKKSCLVERDSAVWVFVVIAPYWEERG